MLSRLRPKAIITRTESISSSHRLHSPHLSSEENREIFGKCNNPNGHGHNYIISVSLKGEIDTRKGMVINITDLKRFIQAAIIDPLDHKNLDLDVAWFAQHPSTTENVALFCWESLKAILPQPDLLYEITIKETDKNSVTYRGE